MRSIEKKTVSLYLIIKGSWANIIIFSVILSIKPYFLLLFWLIILLGLFFQTIVIFCLFLNINAISF